MKKTLAITAIFDRLICHEFETEADALKAMPYIKQWDRETWDSRYEARYHSKKAIRFWDSIRGKRGFRSTQIIHVGKVKTYIHS